MRTTAIMPLLLLGLISLAFFIPVGEVHAQVVNLISNPSVDVVNPANTNQPLDWASNVWGTTKATFTYPTTGHTGRSVKTQVTLAGSGDAKWYPKHIPVTPGQTLIFSDWYQSTVGSTVTIEYKLQNGTFKYVDLGTLSSSSVWKQYSKSFVVPASVQSMTVYHLIKSVGTLTTDDYSLTSSSAPPPPAFNFTLTTGGNKSVIAGQSVTNAITATLSSGTTQPVTFSASGLPSGVTASFSQPTCSPTCSSTLTLSATSSAPSNISTITITGIAGTTTKTTSFTLTTQAAPPPPAFNFTLSNSGTKTLTVGQSTTTLITATLSSGSTVPVTFSTSTLPSGVTASFSSPSCNPTCTTNMILIASVDAPASTSTVSVTGTAGALSKTTSFTLVVKATPPPPPAFNFTLTTGGNKSVVAGQSVTNAITATLSSGTTQPVTFSASGLPSGVTASFSQPTCSPTCSSTLTLSASSGSAPTTTTVTVLAEVGVLNKTATFTLDISTPPPPPSGNLVQNNSLEVEQDAATPSLWSHNSWGTNTPAFTYLQNTGHTGTHSVKVQISSYTNGDAKWYFAPISVTPGDSFAYFDWYQSDVSSHIVADFEKTDGTHYYAEIGTAPASATWAQFSGTLQVPVGAKSVTIFHFINQVGSLTIDDVSLTSYTSQGFTRALVSLTFDDGWEENISTVIPTLGEYGFDSTVFFATTFLENSPQTGALGVSGPATILAMQADGHEIGAHTVTHPDITTLTQTELAYELEHSKAYLESVVGVGNVKNFASPFGTYNEFSIAKAMTLYTSLRTTDTGYNTRENFDPFRMKVQNMLDTTTLAEYQSWIDQAIEDKTWLVIVYHRVASTGIGPYDTPIADFKPQMDIIKNSGITVLPIQQALAETISQF